MRLYSFAINAGLVFGSTTAWWILQNQYGNLNWSMRIGAFLVGVSVFLQGFLSADETRFAKVLNDRTTVRHHILQASYVVAIYGTLLGAFGDLIAPYFGIGLK